MCHCLQSGVNKTNASWSDWPLSSRTLEHSHLQQHHASPAPSIRTRTKHSRHDKIININSVNKWNSYDYTWSLLQSRLLTGIVKSSWITSRSATLVSRPKAHNRFLQKGISFCIKSDVLTKGIVTTNIKASHWTQLYLTHINKTQAAYSGYLANHPDYIFEITYNINLIL
jgi:hypothetical protein